MAETIGSALYELGVDMRPLKKGVSDAEAAFKKSGAAAEQAYGRNGVAASKKMAASQGILVKQAGELKKGILAGVGIGAGVVGFQMLAAGVGKVVDVMGDAITAAAEDEASIAKLTVAIEENDAAWNGNIEAVEEVIASRMDLAFADEEQRDSLAVLTAVTKDHVAALELQRTAMDFARLKGMSLASASDVLGKVYAGNTTSLRRMGIILEETATSADYLAEVQRRAAGQAEAFADTTAGKMQRAQLQMGEALEALGYALTPIVADFAAFAADVIPAISAAIGELGQAFNDLNRFLNPHIKLQQDMLGVVEEVAKAMGVDEAAVRAATEARVAALKVESDLADAREIAITANQAEIDSLVSSAEMLEQNGATRDQLASSLREWTGLTWEQFNAASAQTDGLREQVEALVLAQEGVVALTEEERLNAEAMAAVTRVALETTIAQQALAFWTSDAAEATEGATDATDTLNAEMRSVEGATGVAISGWKAANKELRGLTRAARAMGDENDHTGKRLRTLVAQEERLREQQARAAERGNARQVAAMQLAIDKNNAMQAELRGTLNLLDLIKTTNQIRINFTSNLASIASQAAGLFGERVVDAGDVSHAGGGGGRPRRRRPQFGGFIFPGEWAEVGETGRERIANIGGMTVVQPMSQGRHEGGGRGGIVVNINAGAFLGRPLDAQRFAQEVAPAIGRELSRIGL